MDGTAPQNPKLADLAKDTTHYDSSKEKLTTDWGNKVSNTDHWLSVSTEDKQGPALLEDGHGREKVFHFYFARYGLRHLAKLTTLPRSTASIMSVSRSALSTHAVPVLSVPSSYMRAQKTLQRQGYSQTPLVQPPSSSASLPYSAVEEAQTLFGTCGVSPSNSIPRRVIGTSLYVYLAIISPYSVVQFESQDKLRKQRACIDP